ncbi:hypothetical protein P170DRAFT_61541 [Aspergillus steynii IBT 23096]|uniref:Uncharacterized protein n=1 Tax=Aspergillus steynii IBT 23096 TaxID=1392250 RepID=A0A2I2FT12_9EURO|nr:uncharacterized protein P170DRAFT_61541 [Aspergillus steynii IBT 23096]PLB43754.1 hypothetical protein P170DRAFT_61541 [Aspergillus steynii IBT 23096]
MMRSGIHKPGAIPFLALLVFSLLSLVPSLAKEWDLYNLQVGYIGYQRHDVRQAPRVKDDSIDMWSRFRTSGARCQSWMIDDSSCQPPRRAVLDTPQDSFEAATIYDEPAPYVEGPSTLTRGVRAFKAFVKQLDSRPAAPLDSTEGSETVSTRRTPASFNASIPPLHFGHESCPSVHEDSALSTKPSWHIAFRESWQQACRVGNDYIEKIAQYRLGEKALQPVESGNSSESQLTPPSKPSEEIFSEARPANGSVDPGAPRVPSRVLSTQPPNPTVTTAGQSKNTGFGQDSEHMRGSCMAIVIALVAGVMWF